MGIQIIYLAMGQAGCMGVADPRGITIPQKCDIFKIYVWSLM